MQWGHLWALVTQISEVGTTQTSGLCRRGCSDQPPQVGKINGLTCFVPTPGLYQSLPMIVGIGLENYFKGNYFLNWGISVYFRRVVNRFIKKRNLLVIVAPFRLNSS